MLCYVMLCYVSEKFLKKTQSYTMIIKKTTSKEMKQRQQ